MIISWLSSLDSKFIFKTTPLEASKGTFGEVNPELSLLVFNRNGYKNFMWKGGGEGFY